MTKNSVTKLGIALLFATTAFGCGLPDAPEAQTAALSQSSAALTNASSAQELEDGAAPPAARAPGATQNPSVERPLPRPTDTAAWSCTGWPSQYCLTKCAGMDWQAVGAYPSIAYGQCTDYAIGYCARFGRSMQGVCWGSWR